MQKLILIYDTGDEFEGYSRITLPIYYESAEAALVHFMDKVRELQSQQLKHGTDENRWRSEFNEVTSMKDSEKKNQRWTEVWAKRPQSINSYFEFSGHRFYFHNFLSQIEASATSKAKTVEYPPEILTVDEFFKNYSRG